MFIDSKFRPAWWASNRHLQTVWGTLFRGKVRLPELEHCRLELDDGDFVDLNMHLQQSTTGDQGPGKTVLLLHGLEGSIDSSYIQGMLARMIDDGLQVVVMHFRGCSGESNRLLRSYHSGVSDDLNRVLLLLAERGVQVDYLVGFSLGGNVLLKWLGENWPKMSVKAAVAISVPLKLDECANAIGKGFSRLYAYRLLKTLKAKTLEKKKLFDGQVPISNREILKLNSFWAFDQQVTAPLHGFEGACDYYNKVSSGQYLKSIGIPTLIIHSRDDPFMNHKVIPAPHELSPKVEFELSDNGGHVGFVKGRWPWQAEYYLEERVSEFLDQQR